MQATRGLFAALCAFAGNSLLCRSALRDGSIDAASFTLLRLLSGAVALGALSFASAPRGKAAVWKSGRWDAALALAAYALLFSFAYLKIDAGIGALVLFGAVQVTMIAWGCARAGRPSLREWCGLLISLSGLALLTLPGKSAPDAAGLVLMAGAGIAWGIYSLLGRGATSPLSRTAGNFVRALPLAFAVAAATSATRSFQSKGVILGIVSGAVTSGAGYAIWYSVLPRISPTRAAIAQLAVPVLAAVAAFLWLGERLQPMQLGAMTIVLAGVAMAMIQKSKAGAT
jgi:drug/metabolite transporter (DMT)-like permease